MATLPVNMETCEEDLKVSKATTAFVLPLGATDQYERQRDLLWFSGHVLRPNV